MDAALHWIDQFGDRDGDGFIEYHRQSTDGLIHQGWKDSDDAVFHRDGTLVEGPFALCEVQGYVYAARRAVPHWLKCWVGTNGLANWIVRPRTCVSGSNRVLVRRSVRVRAGFGRSKQPCRVRSSNAGQCLFTGIARTEYAKRVARVLLGPELFSGWGIRTIASNETTTIRWHITMVVFGHMTML